MQDASDAFVDRLHAAGARVSMAAVGNPNDNAKAERFFRTLMHEEVDLNQYDSFAAAAANIGYFIEHVVNAKRLYSSLGYRPPAEFEAVYAAAREGALIQCPA